MNKKTLSERDICTQYITPAIAAAQWNPELQMREEVRQEEHSQPALGSARNSRARHFDTQW